VSIAASLVWVFDVAHGIEHIFVWQDECWQIKKQCDTATWYRTNNAKIIFCDTDLTVSQNEQVLQNVPGYCLSWAGGVDLGSSSVVLVDMLVAMLIFISQHDGHNPLCN